MVRVDRRLAPADHSITRTGRTCGSTVTLDLRCDGGRIEAMGYRTRACLLGMAATAVVAGNAPGHALADALAAGDLLRRLLQGLEVEFPSRWEELMLFEAARSLHARHDAILLPFDALAEVDGRSPPVRLRAEDD